MKEQPEAQSIVFARPHRAARGGARQGGGEHGVGELRRLVFRRLRRGC
jgi:hypothetical protein